MQTSCMRLPGSSRDSSAFPRCLRSLIGICPDLGEPNSVSISTWRSNRKAEHLVLPGGVTKSPLRCGRGSVATSGGCRKDWHSAAIGAVLSSDLGANGALRSCPAGLIADAGLRWCGSDAVKSRMEDLNVKVCQETIICKIATVGEGGKARPTVC